MIRNQRRQSRVPRKPTIWGGSPPVEIRAKVETESPPKEKPKIRTGSPHKDVRAIVGSPHKDVRAKVGSPHKDVRAKNEEVVDFIEDELGITSWMRSDKLMTNRACDVVSEHRNLQNTNVTIPREQYQNMLIEQYGFEPVIPDTFSQLKELKKLLCDLSPRVENSSQYVNPRSPQDINMNFASTSEESPWLNVDTVDEIDKFIPHKDVKQEHQKEIRISDIARVKIIAEKFYKYTKGTIELRRLDEKIVCIEYDVYDQADHAKPIQTMRAFFSIKPTNRSNGKESSINPIPSNIKDKFKISDEDFKKLNEKEIEIIDGKISENKPYLDDLNRVLKRKLAIRAKQNKSTLDLKYLYEMAKRESPPLDSNTNLLSKAELDEIKDLILQRRSSSAHGISRKTLKENSGYDHAVSESIFMEILENAGISAVSNAK